MYELTDNNELSIHYYCKAKDASIVNLTNHSYFNLNGHNSGTILKHKMWIDSDGYTPTDEQLIPTGEIVNVENTPMDFRQEKTVGQDINDDYEALKIATGYDHNYVLKGEGYRKVASLTADQSNITMEVFCFFCVKDNAVTMIPAVIAPMKAKRLTGEKYFKIVQLQSY